MNAVEFLVGPATFLNEAVIQIDDQFERLAARVSPSQLQRLAIAVATEIRASQRAESRQPRIHHGGCLRPDRPPGTPKPRLAYLFPNRHSAQIVLRLRPDLSEGERHRALGLIRVGGIRHDTAQRVRARGKSAPCFALHGGRYVVSGVPVVVDGLARALKDALLVLLAVAVGVMALVLLLVFRSRFRLLPLLLALWPRRRSPSACSGSSAAR